MGYCFLVVLKCSSLLDLSYYTTLMDRVSFEKNKKKKVCKTVFLFDCDCIRCAIVPCLRRQCWDLSMV